MLVVTLERTKRLGEVMHSGLTVLRVSTCRKTRLKKKKRSPECRSYGGTLQNTLHYCVKIYHRCYFIHSLFLRLKRVVYKYVHQHVPNTQSESEQSLVLEDLCFRFLFLFFLSFFFFSFLFFLFLPRWWSEDEEEDEEEEEEELSELEEVVSWSSCCSCWILEAGRAGRRGERGGGIRVKYREENTTDAHSDARVGRHLKCSRARHFVLVPAFPDCGVSKCLLLLHISSNCQQCPRIR